MSDEPSVLGDIQLNNAVKDASVQTDQFREEPVDAGGCQLSKAMTISDINYVEGGLCTERDVSPHRNDACETEDEQLEDSYESTVDESDGEETSPSDSDELNAEIPLTEEEIEQLLAEFLEVESKAAEAQESLEEESLARVESEVRLELSEKLNGDELESAVSAEMDAFREEWETTLDELESQSASLLEQLDGSGIELPSLYKWIESQAPDVCQTDAWKKRNHWVGSQMTSETDRSVKNAEEYLQSRHPVRRKHGKLLEEGASGFLAGRLPSEDKGITESHERSWCLFNDLIQSRDPKNTSFGSSNWASVYLASTPQEATQLGLQMPGVDEVEEIDDIDGNYSCSLHNLNEIELSEVQKRNYKKVREEDDVKKAQRLQCRLKQRRKESKKKGSKIDLLESNVLKSDKINLSGIEQSQNEVGPISSPEALEDADFEPKKKRNKTIIIVDSDDDLQMFGTKSCSLNVNGISSPSQVEKKDVTIDVDLISSPHFKLPEDNCVGKFKCTICSEVLKAVGCHRHPVLEVIICGRCRFSVVEKNRLKGPQTGAYCTWCVCSERLLSCASCQMPFCMDCVERNFGEQSLLEAKGNNWRCCCCVPNLLKLCTGKSEEALGSTENYDSDTENTRSKFSCEISERRKRKGIRRIIDDAELAEETKSKIALEKARQEHLKAMLEESASTPDSEPFVLTSKNILGDPEDSSDGYIVNIAREKDEEAIKIPRSISIKLKPHQVAGVRFMWENVIQSVKKVKSGNQGLGCILAHNMGLGKTFQVIAFLYTVMRNDLGLRTALIVTPVNVLHNWKKEFQKWQPSELKPLRIYMLEDVPRVKRPILLSKWRVKGGILLMGYASFRNLSLGKHIRDSDAATEICAALHDGPDILVCDEAHMIKNRSADTTKALKQVKTQRRIALTGSPLQNNLMEYYCMVDFVREGYLGSSHEFRNRFQNPIENGQHTNSTPDDVKIMNQRSHILYEQLKGFVQRMDMNVAKEDLPPKTVFVITVKLHQLQRELYKKFLDVHGFTANKDPIEKFIRPGCFFANYQTLAQIWNHPGLLQMAKEQKVLHREDATEGFILDDSSSDDDIENDDSGDKASRSDAPTKKIDRITESEDRSWWESILSERIYEKPEYSGKMVMLLDILSMSSECGDKALVFSQSLTTLDLIEFYLSKFQQSGKEGKYWKSGKDWYRLDGSTPSSERQNIVEKFNDPTNTRVKCTIISTRAGSLGINLHAANRVILVDGSWNPTHDLQAIYRAWRYGQNKPVYAYRLVAHGTMEEKIYKRQVTKEGLAARVVDRQQVHRTMSKEEIRYLFEFGDEELPEQSNIDMDALRDCRKAAEAGRQDLATPLLKDEGCSDQLLSNLLSRHHPRWIANYHEHDTLLQENEAERLTKEEQDMAWLSFQRSLDWGEVQRRDIPDSESRTRENKVPQQHVRAAAPRSRSVNLNNPTNLRKCSNLAHLLTLRSCGTKAGCSTECAECKQLISWESLNREGKTKM